MSFTTAWALKLLNVYLAFRYRASFHSVNVDVSAVQGKVVSDQSVLFIANHSSWWDGFFVFEVFKKLKLKKEFKIVMLESELKKFPFFRLCGAVGLIPKNLQHNEKIFKELKNYCVCFFPQGHLTPQNERPLIFRAGINDLIRELHPVQIIVIGVHIEPLHFMKPTALIKASYFAASDGDIVDRAALAVATEKNLDQISHEWTKQIFLTRAKP
ncbi:MAG: 1-acyl-sn-glycerol-3-phosphate acyltransferase [Bdellovibrio sp.]|nr:1-acyl-sn-glycerol-3-phosphate acyltransferase [Bdellovibrio sp.]